MSSSEFLHGVNYAPPRSFGTILKANLKEALFPDDPFHEFKNEKLSTKLIKGTQYFVPICQWLPKYDWKKNFKFDLLAGITIASLAIPQGISYAKLAELPPIIGLSVAPIAVVVIGCVGAYWFKAEKHGIAIEGIAIGRSFSILDNEQIDGNKEMIALGLMNIAGSFTSCYLTTGPFSKTAVNHSAGCKTQMSNVVMSVCMLLTLLFLAPLFGYTPLVALAAIIMSAMLGLIDYDKAIHLYKTDKYDFLICMAAFLGVAFISMDMGLMLSVGLALIRALLYVARPPTCKLGNITDTAAYRDVEQYPGSSGTQGMLILKLGSPIYFPNSNYIRERILRWVRDEQSFENSKRNEVEYLILDLGGITSIDITGVETLFDIRKCLEAKSIKMILVNPRIGVMEKLLVTHFIDKIGKESVFLTIEDAIENCRFSLKSLGHTKREDVEFA
ncbi:putative sulfate transporter 3.5 [Capsicum baccatum]|uniref:Sulfate transporter 3.5 n=1 Tax=Capsicum baccatum TaxID=33114 RepID=A0A2G2X3F5_CAPBA|nr:putative sulfate transporter 3.5 [Capsicum baccatum]